MAWNAEGLKKKLAEMTSNNKKRPINNAAGNALSKTPGAIGNAARAKKSRKKQLEEAAKW